jgi:hypothetical protein
MTAKSKQVPVAGAEHRALASANPSTYSSPGSGERLVVIGRSAAARHQSQSVRPAVS